MARELFGLTRKDRDAVDMLLRAGKGGQRRSRRPVPTRRRNRSGGSGGSIILCQVNKASHVFPSETTFPVDNVIVYSGSGPSAGSEVTDSDPPSGGEDEPVTDGSETVSDGGVVTNFWKELLLDDDWLWAAYDAENERWIPDRIGTKLREFVVASTISAATGFGSSNWGSGMVQFKHPTGGGNIGSPVAIKNSYFDAYPINAVGQADTTGDFIRLITCGCTLAPS